MTDGLVFGHAVLRHHPDPFRSVEREAFLDAAATSDTVVDLMALAASLGERNGHTAIHPHDDHTPRLNAYAVELYEFDNGVHVVRAEEPELVGCEIVAVAGVEIDELMRAVAPLVAHDNDWTIRARRPGFVTCPEVLAGLGVADGAAPFRVGTTREIVLQPRPRLAPPERPAPWRVEPVDDAVYVAYDVTRGDTTAFAREVEAAAARRSRVVLDLRRNGGGDNRTYGPLLAALELASGRGKRLFVLTSRTTFSAAMQLVVDLERRTPAVFVGEPTGGSPNQYGDAISVALPRTGLTARVATVSWETAGPGDERTTREPDVAVPADSRAFFAGRDLALEAALDL